MRFCSLFCCVLLLVGCVGPKRARRAQAQVELGTAYYREGNVEGAIGTLRRASEIDPRNWRARNTLGVAYAAKAEPELAEASFLDALRINPGEAEILLNYGAFLVRNGRADEGVGQLTLALDDLDYRAPAIIQNNLAYALMAAGRPDEGLPWAREAIRRAPALCEAWFNLGLIQESRKDTLGALEAYAQLGETCPDQAIGGRLRTGCLQLQVGMSEEGESNLRDVIAAAPGTRLADEARGCLGTASP